MGVTVEPDPLAQPPDIDPRQYAVESRSWGEEFTVYVVSYDGKWFTWSNRPRDDGPEVWEQPDEAAARSFMADRMAQLLLISEWGDRVASVSAVDAVSTQTLFMADLLDGGEDGIWLAGYTSESDDQNPRYELAGFSDLGAAVRGLAARTDQVADAVAGQDISWPEMTAGYLRYCAAVARAGAARAELGDLVRRSRKQIKAERSVGRVALTVGVSRVFLYRVLDGTEWTWESVMSMRKHAPSALVPDGSGTRVEYYETWTAVIQMMVQAPDKMAALAIEDGALGGSDLPFLGQTTAQRVEDGLWMVTENLHLDDVESFDPDTARSRLHYLMGLLPEQVPWSAGDGERQASASWQPDVWDQATPDEYLHPAIRGVRLIVSLDSREG